MPGANHRDQRRSQAPIHNPLEYVDEVRHDRRPSLDETMIRIVGRRAREARDVVVHVFAEIPHTSIIRPTPCVAIERRSPAPLEPIGQD
jgi:hypothetical protein